MNGSEPATGAPAAASAARYFCAAALRIREASMRRGGGLPPIEIVGHSPALVDLLSKLEKVVRFEEPVLIQGESGSGKESLAQAIHLLGPRRQRPFVSVNCPQFQEGNLTVSELFGHVKGSFTGAVADRKGCFEIADKGVVFLDEIGDLGGSAQLMLLRTLSSGEFRPLGSDQVRKADVRMVTATNRALNQLVDEGNFRKDLFFRLNSFLLQTPPLRARADDWRLLVDFVLERLHERYGISKRFSDDALKLLSEYSWPGNVRELIGVVTAGYALSDDDLIRPHDIAERLDDESPKREADLDSLLRRLQSTSGDFWKLVHEPFLERDLSRREVRRVVARGLRESGGSYRRLLELWRIPAAHYQKFMDFLRHQRLKPRGFGDGDDMP